MITLPKLDNYYQPVPFEEYEDSNKTVWRKDSIARYEAIKQSLGDVSVKCVMDFGCANGYFMFRLVQDGAVLCLGIETKPEFREFINELGPLKGLNVKCLEFVPEGHFDIILYLDLFEGDTKFLCKLSDSCNVLICSPAGNGNERNRMLENALTEIGRPFELIHKGSFEQRNIYKV